MLSKAKKKNIYWYS